MICKSDTLHNLTVMCVSKSKRHKVYVM